MRCAEHWSNELSESWVYLLIVQAKLANPMATRVAAGIVVGVVTGGAATSKPKEKGRQIRRPFLFDT